MTDSSTRTTFITLAFLLAPFVCAAPTPNRPVRDVGARAPPTLAEKRSARPHSTDPFASALEDLSNPDLNYSSTFYQQPIRGNDSVDDIGLWRRQTASACLDSTATDVTINLMLFHGKLECGAGTVVSLCPGASIILAQPVFFTAAYQELITEGLPTDGSRATLVVSGPTQSNAVYGPCDACDYIAVRNIQVDGQRDSLGYLDTGIGLVEIGGMTTGQIVDNCHLFDPRGWTALHGIEGTDLSCINMTISNNQIGPSGNSPTTGLQFRGKRDQVYAPGQWADGISLACKGSLVSNNIIIDATDGGIVIFQAPGSLITRNTIWSKTRTLLGGINAVDYEPFDGAFTDTVVEKNLIFADTAMIKVGMGLGTMTWGYDNNTAARTFGGVFRDNVFLSGDSGYFGYAISVAGHEDATVLNNDATHASFGGDPSLACIPAPAVPTSQAFIFDEYTSPGYTLQDNFVSEQIQFLICQQPGMIVATGPATALGNSVLIGVENIPGIVTSPVPDVIASLLGNPGGLLPTINLPGSLISNSPTSTSAAGIPATGATSARTRTAMSTTTPTATPTASYLSRASAISGRRESALSVASAASVAAASSEVSCIASSLASAAAAAASQLLPALPTPPVLGNLLTALHRAGSVVPLLRNPKIPVWNPKNTLPVWNPKNTAARAPVNTAAVLAQRPIASRRPVVNLKRGEDMHHRATASKTASYSRVTPVTPPGMENPYLLLEVAKLAAEAVSAAQVSKGWRA